METGRDTRVSRRGFLTAAGATAAAVGAPGALASVAGAHGRGGYDRGRPDPARPHQHPAVHPARPARDRSRGDSACLERIGYRRVEHAGFVGRTVTEFKAALDAAGLRATSGHVLIPQPFNAAAWEASLQDALTLRSIFIVHPFFGITSGGRGDARLRHLCRVAHPQPRRSDGAARRAAARVPNHNWEFFVSPTTVADRVRRPHRGDRPRYVHFELHLFWSWRARRPVDILHRIDGRVRQYHVKDLDQAGLRGPGPGPDRLRADLPDPGGRRVHRRARRRGLAAADGRRPHDRPGGLRVPGEPQPPQAQIGAAGRGRSRAGALWESPIGSCPALVSTIDSRAGRLTSNRFEPAGAEVRAPLVSGLGGDSRVSASAGRLRLRDGRSVIRDAERSCAHGGASLRPVPAPTARSRQDPRCFRTGSW